MTIYMIGYDLHPAAIKTAQSINDVGRPNQYQLTLLKRDDLMMLAVRALESAILVTRLVGRLDNFNPHPASALRARSSSVILRHSVHPLASEITPGSKHLF